MWKSILVAYDGSAQARKAVRIACEIAQGAPDAQVTFTHVAVMGGGAANTDQSMFDLASAIQQDLEQLAATLPNQTQVRLLTGTSPAELLLRAAEDVSADLIIMGSRGMGGVRGYLGSVSTAVTQRTRASVLITKDAD